MKPMKPLWTLFAALTLLTACVTGSDQTTDDNADTAKPSQLGSFASDQAGFDTQTFYYDTGREVVVFDAQFTEELSRQFIAAIKAKTDSPIRYVVITHPNPDKFNGVGPFQELGATVIASDATAAAIPDVHAYKKYYFVNIAGMFTDDTYPPQATVDQTFSGSMTLELDGGTVTLKELVHSGVSSTQTVAWVPDHAALFVGDLVHHEAHAWLEGGIVNGAPQPDLSAWKSALGELLAFEGANVYGGRGGIAPVAEAVDAQIRYLDTVGALVEAYVNGLDDAQASLQGDEAGLHHKAMAEEASRAFPSYALAYMIEFGVYGLAGAFAASQGE